MAQFDFYDPRFQGLATLAAGLLSQSGWQPQRVGLGQAFGQAVPPALQAMNQARQQQISMEDLKQLRLMRALQMRKLGFEVEQEEALPGQLNQWAQLISAPGAMSGNQPQVAPPMSLQEFPVPTPLAPYDPNQAMQQNLLGPFAGGQPDVPRGTGPVINMPDVIDQSRPAPVSDVDMLGSQAKGLYDFADKLETDFARRFPNPHPKLAQAAEKQITSIRTRAERLKKESDRLIEKQGKFTFEEFAVGGTPDEPVFQKFRVMADGSMVPLKGLYKKKAGVEINMPAATKYSEKFGGGMADRDISKYDEALSAREGVAKLDDLLTHLEMSDAITGLGAEVFKNVERAKTLLLNDIKSGKKVSDTELLDAMLGSDVFPMIKALGIGARGLDTPAERVFLRQVMTGTIDLNKQTLTKMAEIRRNVAQRAVEQWNQRLKTIPRDALEGAGITREPIELSPRQFKSQQGLPAPVRGGGWSIRKLP